MKELNNGQGSDVNNQGDSGVVEPVGTADGGATDTGITTGTNSETDKGTKEPEFSDPNMQKAWTEKTQKLAEERKTFESERESFGQSKADIDKKLEILKRLDADPEIVNFVRNRWGGATKETAKPQVTENDLLEAQTNPAKLKEVIETITEQKAEAKTRELINPVFENVRNLRLENEIMSYMDSEGNEDFEVLDKTGLIRPLIYSARTKYPNASEIELVRIAHNEARKIINSATSTIEKTVTEKSQGRIQEKKSAIIDKGGKTSVSGVESTKGKSITEIGLSLLNK